MNQGYSYIEEEKMVSFESYVAPKTWKLVDNGKYLWK